MGLHYAYHKVDTCVTRIPLTRLPRRFTLIFDGLFFIFVHQKAKDETDMAKAIASVVCDHIRAIKQAAPWCVFQSVFLLDGKSPHAKKHTQSKRTYCDKNLDLVKQLLREDLTSEGIQMLQLTIGEAEAEAMHQRTGPVVIVTNDSDMFHLGYGYPMKDENDRVIFAKKNFAEIYDFSKPLINLDRTVFKVLLFCTGTDFSASVITRSMFGYILDHMNVLEQLRLPPDPSPLCLVRLLVLFCHLACIKTQPFTKGCFFPRKRMNGSMDLNGYVDILQWCLSYSNQGAKCVRYRDQIPFIELELVPTLCKLFHIEPCSTQALKQKLISFSTHALVAQINQEDSSVSNNSTCPIPKPEGLG